MGFATWQLVLLVAKSDPYLPRTVARVVRTAGGLIRTVFSYRGKETLDNQNQIYILKIVCFLWTTSIKAEFSCVKLGRECAEDAVAHSGKAL